LKGLHAQLCARMSVTQKIKYTRAFKMAKQVFAAVFCLMVSGFAVKFSLTVED